MYLTNNWETFLIEILLSKTVLAFKNWAFILKLDIQSYIRFPIMLLQMYVCLLVVIDLNMFFKSLAHLSVHALTFKKLSSKL